MFLSENPEETVLNIARETDIHRTTVYRIIDRLMELGLVEEIIVKRKKYYKAVGMHKIEILVKERESEVDYLRKLLPKMHSVFKSQETLVNPAFKINSYKDKRGVKEALKNIHRANNEIVRVVKFDLEEILDTNYHTWVLKLIQNKNEFKEIHARQEILTISLKETDSIFSSISVNPKRLPVDHEVYIYNNVVLQIFQTGGDYQALEIYSKEFTKQYKSLIDLACV